MASLFDVQAPTPKNWKLDLRSVSAFRQSTPAFLPFHHLVLCLKQKLMNFNFRWTFEFRIFFFSIHVVGNLPKTVRQHNPLTWDDMLCSILDQRNIGKFWTSPNLWWDKISTISPIQWSKLTKTYIYQQIFNQSAPNF